MRFLRAVVRRIAERLGCTTVVEDESGNTRWYPQIGDLVYYPYESERGFGVRTVAWLCSKNQVDMLAAGKLHRTIDSAYRIANRENNKRITARYIEAERDGEV